MENQTTPAQSPAPVKSQPKPKTNWKFQFQQYGGAVLVAIPIFVALSVYLYYRRGYYDLYIINKIFAGVAVVLLGIILLLGPVCRFFNLFDKYLQYRKELGVTAMWLAVAHSVTSLFFLQNHFSTDSLFGKGLITTTFGIASILTLIFLFVISRHSIMNALGVKAWWWLQNWGVRLAFVLIALHVFIMKMPSWISWYQKGGSAQLVHPEWPGAGLLVGWFMAFVIFIRLAEIPGKNYGKAVWYLSIVALPVIYIYTFVWGYQFAK